MHYSHIYKYFCLLFKCIMKLKINSIVYITTVVLESKYIGFNTNSSTEYQIQSQCCGGAASKQLVE